MSAARHRPIIALVTDAIYPYHKGGKEMRYHELSRRLCGYGQVDVYTMQWWDGPRTRTEDGVTFHALTPRLPLYVDGRRSILQAIVFALGCLRLLGRRFDVIEADHMPYFCLFPLRLVATLRRKRLVVTWHEVWGPDYWRDYLGRAGAIGWAIERVAMRLPDHILAASAETAERLAAQLGSGAAITVAPNGVDLAAIRAIAPAEARVDLVTVGRLLSHKRVDLLLEAVAELDRQGRAVTASIIGDGPERGVLQERARTLGIADRVSFLSEVHGHDELFSLVKAGTVFAFPSEREGFGIAVLEALACGLPVVTTSAPDNLAQHLVARASRGTVTAPDAPAFATALLVALDAARDATAPAPSSEAWLSDYDWTTVTARVAEAMAA
jgi:glycosyltransferase involved in cell wall biosynthesis